MLELAKELLEEERKIDAPDDRRQQARNALTQLFESTCTDKTPEVVKNVVNDIDNEVVNIVRQFKKRVPKCHRSPADTSETSLYTLD